MSQQYQKQYQPYAQEAALPFEPAAYAEASERAVFIKRTYLHVAGALVVFAAVLATLVTMVPTEVMQSIFAHGKAGILIIMVAFIAASFLSARLARPDMPLATQYLGLGLYICV